LVDIGQRFGLVSPFTSLYVPTRREASQDERDETLADKSRLRRWKPWASARFDRTSGDSKESGTGTRAKGEEGSMANATREHYVVQQYSAFSRDTSSPTENSTSKRYAVQGPKNNPDPHIARQARLEEARKAGMIGQLSRSAARESDPPPAPWGRDTSLGTHDDLSVRGNRSTLGHGEGGAFGTGHGRLGGSLETEQPTVRLGTTTVNGRLPTEVVQRIVRQNFGRFRLCYEQGLSRNPNLEGRVIVRFVIERDGSLSNLSNAGSDLPDSAVVSCVISAYSAISFPQPERGIVSVVYPIEFSGGKNTASPIEPPLEPYPKPLTLIGAIGHDRAACGKAADLPLSERLLLWRERLWSASSVATTLNVYRQALRDCEASDWRERSVLLVQIVNRLEGIHDRVALWRALLATSPVAANAVYRLLLLRVQTSADLKELHDALGLERIDPELLAALLKKARSPAERLASLRGAAERFADDTELALAVLEAYEDAGDDAGGRAWARKLRRRVDATAHMRTNVGEYYLRLAARHTEAAAQRDADEARRTFGELVEFAPEDPVARRHLGDLLRAHGWYGEALRQYQTLAELTPDDPSVPLLVAAAVHGTGKLEEAVRWAEKAAASGSPEGSSSIAVAARAATSAFLAWARDAAARAGKSDDVERLRRRAARLAAPGSKEQVRLILTWSHPELRPALWTNASGSMIPAEHNLPLLGIAQAFISPAASAMAELRLDPDDAARAARLDAKAVLTAIVSEGTQEERMARVEVGFREAGGKARARSIFRFQDGVLKQETP
jgi:Ca-activated chloride channel family protein